MKNDIINFKKYKIRDATTNKPLETNFGRRGMKKLIENRLERKKSLFNKKVETYTIEAKYIKIEISTQVSKEVMVKEA